MGQATKSTDTVIAEGVVIHETAKAVLINFPWAGKVWIPKSQLRRELDVPGSEQEECTVYIPRWLADKSEIDYDELIEEEDSDTLEDKPSDL